MAEATEQKAAATTKKAAKAKKASRYPAYNTMITEAITALAEKGGSSRQAISKYIVKQYKVSPDDKGAIAQLKLGLKRGVRTGALKQSKGSGASGSFKLGSAKKEEKKKTKTKSAGKTKPKKAKAPKKVTKSPKKADKKVKKVKVAKTVKKPKTPKKAKTAAKKSTKSKAKPKKSASKK